MAGGGINVEVHDVGLNSLDYVNTILFNFPGKAALAAKRAAKRAGNAGRTEAKKYVVPKYNIKAGQFTKNTRTQVQVGGSGGSAASVKITYSGSRLAVLEFKPNVSKESGVTYQAKRGVEEKLPHAFEVNPYGKHIFQRAGRSRFPIVKQVDRATPHMLKDPEVADPLGKKIMEVFNQRLVHEIGYILGKS
nr:hypothetical protein [Clostridia bacterium]